MTTPRSAARASIGAAASLALLAAPLVASPALAADESSTTPAISETRWTGEPGGDLGYGSSRWSCDVNADGYADTIVGDWWWDKSGVSNAGAAYALLGGPDPAGGSISELTRVGAVRIDGPGTTNAFAGMSVSCLGDVNADGFDDLIVGSNRTQRNWVILGSKDLDPVDVDSLGARGFEVTNSDAVAANVSPGTANFGYWVSGLGDINNDGLDDFAITDNLYDRPADTESGITAAANIGRVWVIAGSRDVKSVDVASEAGSARVLATIDGGADGGQISSVENVGDMNGDGLDDIVLGSYAATPWGASAPVAGAAYAVFGSKEPLALSVDDLGDRGFAVHGPQRGRDRLGTAVAPVGDINGDGNADFIVGGDGVSNAATGPRAGGAAVVFGSGSTRTVFTEPGASENAVYSCDDAGSDTSGACAAQSVARGYWIDGAADNDKFGWSAAGVGDINGDGTPDTVVGAWGHDSAGSNAGALQVVYGQPEQTGTVTTAELDPALGFRIDGATAGAQLGRSVGGVSDFDGNGVPDIVGGANGTDYASVFLLGPATTTLALSAGDLSAAHGGRLTAAIEARTGAGAVTGTVAFNDGATVIDGCESVPVEGGEAHCDTDGFPRAGEQTFSAEFTDTTGSFAATTAETTAMIEYTTSRVTVGGDTSGTAGDDLEFTASVGADAIGSIEFFASSTSIGSAPLEDGTATLDYTPEVAGSFQLTARYSGDDINAEATSKKMRVTIAHIPTNVSGVKLSTQRVVYGQRPTATVTVRGADSGNVLFTAGDRDLGVAKVDASGTASLRLPKLGAGTYRVSAQFLGDDAHADSPKRTASSALKITKAKVTSAKVSAKTAKKGTRPTVTVRLGKLDNGAYPTGKVRVKFGSVTKTVTLKAVHEGTVRVRAPKALTSTTKVRVTYLGNANTSSAKAATTQRVKR